MFKYIPLKTEAIARGKGLDTKKYSKRKFSNNAINGFLDTAVKEKRIELGIYISSQDYSRESAPSFIIKVHLGLSNTIGGKTIEKRDDHKKVNNLKIVK